MSLSASQELKLTLHHIFEPVFHSRPLAPDDAEVDRMAIRTIGHDQMIAQHSFSDRSQALNSPLRIGVEMVGSELNTDRAPILTSN